MITQRAVRKLNDADPGCKPFHASRLRPSAPQGQPRGAAPLLRGGQPRLPGDEVVVISEAPRKVMQRRLRPKYERRSYLKAARFFMNAPGGHAASTS